MKFEIGDIVRYYKDNDNSYLVLASEEKSLNVDYINSKKGIYNIHNINELAKLTINVSKGFAYTISKIISSKEFKSVLDVELINVFENDIYR